MRAANILEVQDLRTYFFTRRGVVKAIDGVTFNVKQNETLGLVGESGCGKSVTALSIMRTVDYPGRIVGGKILLNGESLLEKSSDEMVNVRGRLVSMVMQDPMTALNPVYTVEEQMVESFTKHQSLTRREARQRAIETLDTVGIPSPEDRILDYPHRFSGGMRQRIVIAIALSCSPLLLIADEPTTNLDVTVQAEILRLMRDLKAKSGMSILFITHHFGLVAEMCERVAVMYAGEIVEHADTLSLFNEPLHPYTIGLLSCIPERESQRSRLPTIAGTVPDLINVPAGCRFSPRCASATKRCFEERPPLIEARPNHFVACHPR